MGSFSFFRYACNYYARMVVYQGLVIASYKLVLIGSGLVASRREVASAIVKDKNWLDAMRNKTLEQGIVTTPMRKLILKMPGLCVCHFYQT